MIIEPAIERFITAERDYLMAKSSLSALTEREWELIKDYYRAGRTLEQVSELWLEQGKTSASLSSIKRQLTALRAKLNRAKGLA
ncbi:MAG: hypothetical protein PHI27_01995 [Eubacteriales bacterium]|nr:hypothetical protein [Eubacteriales bacterium]MDD3881004.1 hypothetical protein [Eubacteriales bacterium]MDD4511927.1 hypothetical protein [Eubacteriales bacterium]